MGDWGTWLQGVVGGVVNDWSDYRFREDTTRTPLPGNYTEGQTGGGGNQGGTVAGIPTGALVIGGVLILAVVLVARS